MSDQEQKNTMHNPAPLTQSSAPAPKNCRKIVNTLWQRKATTFITMLIIMSASFFYLSLISPRYAATSSVLIEGNTSYPGEAQQDFVSTPHIDTAVLLSEVEVIKSRDLAKKVILRLGLMNDPEFNPHLKITKPNLFNKYFGETVSKDLENSEVEFKQLSVYQQKISHDEKANIMDQNIGLVIDNFLKNMQVQPAEGSFVLEVKFKSKNPVKAALISNTIVDIYLAQNVDIKSQSSIKFTNWLNQRLNSLRAQVRKAEIDVEQLKAENNLIAKEANGLNESGLSNQLVMERAKKAKAEANLQQIQSWVKSPENIDLASGVESSSMLSTLKTKENKLLNKIANLSVRYGPKYPKMVSIKIELKDTQDQMKRELNAMVNKVQAEVKFSENRVSALENSLQSAASKEEDGQSNIHLRELTRELEASQEIFSDFLQTYKRTMDQGELQSPQARVISYATIPLIPYYPNKTLLLSLSVLISFFIGVALALLFEKMVKTFRTSELLEKETGFKCLGLVPAIPVFEVNKPMADYILTKPAIRLAESMRSLRMLIKLRAENKGKKAKVITITSSLPGEGKTTLSAWLARMSAKSAERTIIIDCDLRRPRLHTAFGKEPENSLVEYLTGKCTLEEALFRDPITNMHAIFGRAVPNNALDLLGKDRMTNLINALREQYDLVILDSPACLSVADARLLASKSDQVLYAVAWNDTNKEVVHAGLKQFAEFGYDALNLVLTHVDLKKYSQYGFSDSAYYYSAYNPYYAD